MERMSVERFVDLAEIIDLHKKQDWLYRGLTRSTFDLVPKIGRPMGTSSYKYSRRSEIRLFEEFRRQARPLVLREDLSDLEWLALAQHHGLSTRFLDWTESLLVAAFFATERGIGRIRGINRSGIDETQTMPPVIYGIRELPSASSDANPFRVRSVRVYRPSHISPRIAAQQAALTIHPQPDRPFTSKNLLCITLNISGTIGIKRALDAAGVTRTALFPGIDGLAETLNWQLKWGRLRS